MIRIKFLTWTTAVGIIGASMLLGCGNSSTVNNFYLGNMDDMSYSGQRSADSCVYRGNALGEEVCVAEFEGQFVWADYSAPWCQPCRAQANVIKELESKFGSRVVFLTVITSARSDYQSIPTEKTARNWARQYNLNPARVVYASDRWGMTIPTHILFSPAGQTLYRSIGYLSKKQIQAIIAEYTRDWENWAENGTVASWMKND